MFILFTNLILAYQTSCGCRYCKNCLDKLISNGNTKCLGVDCEDIEKSMPDNAVNKQIANLKVSCLFKSEGCHYEDSLRNMNKHLEECEYRLIPCSECQEIIPKNKVFLRNHLSNCKNRPMACPYSEFGCESRCNSLNINQHFTEENWNHTTSLISYFKKEMSALNDKCNRLSKDYKSLMEDRDNLKQEVTRTALIMTDGTFIWKIEAFKSLRKSAENGDRLLITSEPFYIREFSYKMSMKIYPDEDAMDKVSHLSLFFTLMKGDYDDLLQWPFKNKVTLTILDQKNKTSDYSLDFKPDPRSICYQKPTEKYNIALGSPKFIPFDQVTDTFLMNDTIFLKLQVHDDDID